jgi:hypothetical protein
LRKEWGPALTFEEHEKNSLEFMRVETVDRVVLSQFTFRDRKYECFVHYLI